MFEIFANYIDIKLRGSLIARIFYNHEEREIIKVPKRYVFL